MKMTPEQNVRWQTAVNPLDYLDFYALSKKGRRESERRLTGWGVPEWATQRREYFLADAGEQFDLWKPSFALRSELALIGIQILYPEPDEAKRVYERVFMRFVYELIRPLAEWAQQGEEWRKAGCMPLLELYHLCGKFPYQTAAISRALLWWPRLNHSYNLTLSDDKATEGEIVQVAREIGWYMLEWTRLFVMKIYNVPIIGYHRVPVMKMESILERIDYLHQLLRDGKGEQDSYPHRYAHANLLTDAFLTALEVECPPPAWLGLS